MVRPGERRRSRGSGAGRRGKLSPNHGPDSDPRRTAARIVFKYGDRYQVPVLQDRYRRQFAQRGVLPSRLEFHTRSEPLADHLKMMAAVDLALDSFPYQGTMTSLECLSVGTPIVSCCGEYYAHRATSAMMMRMQFYELVAGDPSEYVEIAVQLLQRDQPFLRQALFELPVRFYVLTPEYNLRTPMPCFVGGNVHAKILHGRGARLRKLMRSVNRNKEPRVFP